MAAWWKRLTGGQEVDQLDDTELEVAHGQIATDSQDGAYTIEKMGDQASVFQQMAHFDFTFSSQAELIEAYRQTAQIPEVKFAIDDIVNEAISFSEDEHAISISLSDVDEDILTEKTRIKIEEVWEQKIINLLDLDSNAYNLFDNFYIDGIIAAHKVPHKSTSKGLEKVVVFDTVDIMKIREETKNADTGIIEDIKEFFKYTPHSHLFKRDRSKSQDTPNLLGSGAQINRPISYVLSKESVAYATSNMRDPETGLVKGWLHEAVRVANQLTTLENALLIYRITRAPERRAFYIDVGGLQASKAEQFVERLKVKMRNRMSFDPTSGTFADKRHMMTMQEDFWLPRQNGRGTEVTTLPGGANLGDIDDILYFMKKLYRALNIPASRMDDSSSSVSFDRSPELSRDELKFTKYVSRVRKRFNVFLSDILRTELLLTNVITEDDWDKIKNQISFVYAQDFYLEERKTLELLRQRMDVATEMGVDRFIGDFFSKEYIRREILKLTETEIDKMDKQIDKERTSGEYDLDDDGEDDFAPPATTVKHKADPDTGKENVTVNVKEPAPIDDNP